jgi:plasmid stabilization system protein ParE
VVLHPLARQELISAALYLDQQVGLGNAFLDEFDQWQRHIQQFPESCPEVGQGIRKGLLERFSYLIGYKIKGHGKDQYVRILYIRHAAQNRSDWTPE